MAQKIRGTDKWIIVGGIVVLLFALSFLAFDDWMWAGRRSSGVMIGEITSRSGDVRVKFSGDVRWQKAGIGDKFAYDDTIFSGSGSQVGIKVGSSELKLGENSLVVLRQQNNAQFLALSYGTISGKVKANDQILIDAGDGKTALLSTKTESEIILKKVGGRTQLQLLKGNAELDHKSISRNQIVAVNKAQPPTTAQPPPPKAPPPPLAKKELPKTLRILSPKTGDQFFSKEPLGMEIQWTYDGQAEVSAKQRFTVEFSKSMNFEILEASRVVDGKTSDTIKVRHSLKMYFRIRGPLNELSEPQQLSFIRVVPPVVLSPKVNATYWSTSRMPATVPIQYEATGDQPLYWMQLSSDVKFETVLVNASGPEAQFSRGLPGGSYYLRARSDFGNGHVSEWSTPVAFQVREKDLAAPKLAFQNQVAIPNREYPAELYSAERATVQKYLAEQGFLNGYFDVTKGYADQVVIDYMNGSRPRPLDQLAWPQAKIYPGKYKYRYQMQKRAQLPSRWSAPERLQIELEPPHVTLVAPDANKLRKDNRLPVRVQFTPLLFASSYEIQLARQRDFAKAKIVNAKRPTTGFYAERKTDYFWRARALDENGKPISAFSPEEEINTTAYEPAIQMAQRRAVEAQRKLASESEPINTSTMSTPSSFTGKTFENPGIWMWVGSGMNYVDYNQSIPGRATFSTASFQPMGAYLEFGWGAGQFGAVASYKSTPGAIEINNATIYQAKFNWQTVTAEGLYCPIPQKSLFGSPVAFGLRAGFQYQEMPFVFLDSSGGLHNIGVNMINASLGATGEWSVNRWRYYLTLRYQYPLSATAQESSFSPEFAFDGSLGAAYYLTERIKAGLFWYGQWQDFNFSTTDLGLTNAGSQMLFYSAVDLRLGYDF